MGDLRNLVRKLGPKRPPAHKDPASGDAPDDRLIIEYSPHLDGDADPGEVVWTWVPYEEDRSVGKDRPVAIIGRRGDMLVGCR